ncbi:hypothetical protein L596_019265 [Steinernema carpocapsae]|uniref:Uncharacterized protein n=1 Tax=Steinernema carpocapsae TaxID=34508 RepID=A0A4U5MQ07_STECR|nr:hypothetical protein L596_019265 [Steinernema carpocapsae]
MIVPAVEFLVQLAVVSVCFICQAQRPSNSARKPSKTSERATASKEGINAQEAANLKRKFQSMQKACGKSALKVRSPRPHSTNPNTLRRKSKKRDNTNDDPTEFENINTARQPALPKNRRGKSKNCSDSSCSTSRSKNSSRKQSATKKPPSVKKSGKEDDVGERLIKRKASVKKTSLIVSKDSLKGKPNIPRPKLRTSKSDGDIVFTPNGVPVRLSERRLSAPVPKDQLPIEEFDMSKDWHPPSGQKNSDKDDDLPVAPTIDVDEEDEQNDADAPTRHACFDAATRIINTCFDQNRFSSFLNPDELNLFNDFFQGNQKTNDTIFTIVNKRISPSYKRRNPSPRTPFWTPSSRRTRRVRSPRRRGIQA